MPFLPPRGKENGDQEAKVISGHLKTQRLSRATQQAGPGTSQGGCTVRDACIGGEGGNLKPYRLGGNVESLHRHLLVPGSSHFVCTLIIAYS